MTELRLVQGLISDHRLPRESKTLPAKRINWTSEEVILVAAQVMANGWKGFDGTSALVDHLSDLLKMAPFHPVADRGPTFRNGNSVRRKSYDIATRHPDYSGTPTNGSHVDRDVLSDFLKDPDDMLARAQAIEAAILEGASPLAPTDDDIEEPASSVEGRAIQAFQRRYERDPQLRKQKIASVLASGEPIACETCDFDFGAFYGSHGDGYIEVHHVIPLHSTGITTTTLDDLALLCSNCHRMIHRRQPWLNPSQLRYKIKKASPGRTTADR